MLNKDKDGRKMASFRLTKPAIQMLTEITVALSDRSPIRHTKTDALEIAIHEYHKKIFRSQTTTR